MSSLALEVVALALKRKSDGRYLLAQRSPGSSGAGQWEFPGGKIEGDESEVQALVREICEELSILISPLELKPVASHIFSYPQKKIHLHLWTVELDLVPEIKLTEHDQIMWCKPNEMKSLNLSEADIYFIDKLL